MTNDCRWKVKNCINKLALKLRQKRHNCGFPLRFGIFNIHKHTYTYTNSLLPHTYLLCNNFSVLSATSVTPSRVCWLFLLSTHSSFLFTLFQLPIQLRRRRYSAPAFVDISNCMPAAVILWMNSSWDTNTHTHKQWLKKLKL